MMNFNPIKEEPMVVDETTRPMDQSQQLQQQPPLISATQNQEIQQSRQYPLQQQILQQPQQQPQPLPSIQPLQQQQQQQQPQHSQESLPSMQQHQQNHEQQQQQQLPTPDENNLTSSEQTRQAQQQQSSHSSQQEQQNPDMQKIPTFSGAINTGPTMTKGNILEAIKDFDSSIPDAVVHHFLNVAGMQTSDQRIVRLIAIAAQKFIHDIVSDSLQHCKLRGAQNKKTKEKKYTLTMEDLGSALAEYGIEVKRQLYFN